MTLSQKIAANPDFSVYVSASAGSGKTKVLTDRVLRLLLEGNDPAKIICLTYTKAAASEMLSRITDKINSWLLLADDDLRCQLEDLTNHKISTEQLTLARKLYFNIIDDIDGIKIYTIHSFCQNIIKKFPIEAGIPPHFKLMDDNSSNALLEESKIRLLTNYVIYDDEIKSEQITKALKNIASSSSEKNFVDNIKSIIVNKEKFYDLFEERTLEQIESDLCDKFAINLNDSEEEIIYQSYKNYDKNLIDQYTDILFSSTKLTQNKASKIKLFFDKIDSKNNIISNFDIYKSVFYNSDLTNLNKSLVTKDIETNHAEIFLWLSLEREKIINVIDKINSVKLINTTINQLHIAEAILTLYNQLKLNMGLIDYNDLIAKAKNLLSDQTMSAWILYKLDGGIDHLLIDESQDTSPMQWQVVEAICEEFFSGDGAVEKDRTLFIVGDEKQSIYSFQGADPKVFNAVQHKFSIKAEYAQKQWKNISLDRSFRSVEAVLNVVDKVFCYAQIKQSISADYKNHISHRKGQYGKVEIWPIEKKPQDSAEIFTIPNKIRENQTVEANLAKKIADNVEDWLSKKRIIKASAKVIAPDDIMILLKKRGTVFAEIIKEFEKRNIPISGSDRVNVKKTLIAQDLIAFANFLLNTSDDLSLAGLLKSPFIGVCERDLFQICHNRGENSIWSVLKNSDNEEHIKIHEYLSEILYKVDVVSTFDLFHHIINSNDSLTKIYANNGFEAKEIINEFMSLVLQYQKTNTPSLQGFLQWFKSQNSDVKRELQKNNGEVRIMTVHASKGLQSPIVIIPDAASTLTKNQDNILFDDNDIMFFNSTKELNLHCKSLRDNNFQSEINEYYRLLYVAMTRAEDELYIAGLCRSEKTAENSWYDIIEKEMQKMAKKIDDKLIYEVGEGAAVREISNYSDESTAVPSLPSLFKNKLEDNNSSEQFDVINPSKIENSDFDNNFDNDNKASLRGKIIHNLLQFLPEIIAENRKIQAQKYIEKHGDILNSAQKTQILADVCAVMESENTKFLFSHNAKAEVPIIGKINGKTISGRIDRLIIKDDEIIVVDYKTTINIPNNISQINKSSLRQLDIYQQIIANIYPNKKVKACIVWTSNASTMFVDSKSS